jgi:hypothetical protein
MRVTWPEDSCEAMIRFGDIIAGWNVTVTDADGDTARVLVSGVGHDATDDGLLRLFGTLLDDQWERVQPRRHYWIRWDDIARLEVH